MTDTYPRDDDASLRLSGAHQLPIVKAVAFALWVRHSDIVPLHQAFSLPISVSWAVTNSAPEDDDVSEG